MGKIIAIGGGEIGRQKEDGSNYPIETTPIDKEIISLTGKRNPKLLFIPTASSDSESYFEAVKKHFEERLRCKVDVLYLLKNAPTHLIIKNKILSSDIIYVGGGNTLKMMNRWKRLGVDKVLLEAYNKNIVLSGLSAGAICWFKYGNSDKIRVKGLSLIDASVCPHYSDSNNNRSKNFEKMMRKTSGIALGIDSKCAIEIINDKYRILSSDKNSHAYKVYWKKGQFYREKIQESSNLKPVLELLKK